jgi:hypothetical protein
MANNVECKYRVTATIKADTKYELEIIKAKLIRARAKILRIDPVTIVRGEEPRSPPKHAASPGKGSALYL